MKKSGHCFVPMIEHFEFLSTYAMVSLERTLLVFQKEQVEEVYFSRLCFGKCNFLQNT